MAIHTWSPPYFDLIFDVLNGCQGQCRGCGVTKSGQSIPTEAEFSKIISNIHALKEDSGFILDHLEVGPTDFTTAVNTKELLASPGFAELSRQFNILYFTTTLTGAGNRDDYQAWAKTLRDLFGRKKIYFYLVIEPTKIDNPELMAEILARVEIFKNTLELPTRFEPVLNSQPNSAKKDNSLLREILNITAEMVKSFESRPWHAISSSRKDDLTAHSALILKDIHWLNSIFNHWVYDRVDCDPHFQYGNELKPTNKAFAWRSGSWYWPPVLYGHFVNYDERFKLPGELTARAIDEFEAKSLVSQYAVAERQEDCASCDHLSQCAQQGILQLAQALETRECIAPRRAFDGYRLRGRGMRANP
ncbi:MAG: hypothetical protein P4M08_10300 [Oligoflexia bacterium]|nr:hypothetical protein [Oligoflexia bacterium]